MDDYLIFQGKFTLYDSMGVTNELREIHYMPSAYIDVEQQLQATSNERE